MSGYSPFGQLLSDPLSSRILGVGVLPTAMPGDRWVPHDEVFGLGDFASGLMLGQTPAKGDPVPAGTPAAPAPTGKPHGGGMRQYGDIAFFGLAATAGVVGFMNSTKTWHKALFGLTVLGAVARVGMGFMSKSPAPVPTTGT